MAVPIGSLAEKDQALVEKVYGHLRRLFAILQEEGAACEQALRGFLEAEDIRDFVDEVQSLGVETYRANRTELVAKAIHDVRGGGLTPLLAQLQLWTLDGVSRPRESLYFLTRDHLKIMRNALLGLDDARRNADLQTKIHGTDLIVEKWHGSHWHSDRSTLRLEVDCPFPVAISDCCVEFGALDRVLYNLLNNACRHAAGDNLQLAIFPVPDKRARNLRFVLLNALSGEDDARLQHTDMESLFRAGVSTTGSGYGLNVAAEFVAHAFGIARPETAVAAGYLGARVLSHRFAIWFHWPILPTR